MSYCLKRLKLVKFFTYNTECCKIFAVFGCSFLRRKLLIHTAVTELKIFGGNECGSSWSGDPIIIETNNVTIDICPISRNVAFNALKMKNELNFSFLANRC